MEDYPLVQEFICFFMNLENLIEHLKQPDDFYMVLVYT